jgi:hypothetical protein
MLSNLSDPVAGKLQQEREINNCLTCMGNEKLAFLIVLRNPKLKKVYNAKQQGSLSSGLIWKNLAGY